MIKLMVPAAAGVMAVLAATNPHEDAHARAMVSHSQKGCGDNAMARLMCGGATALASLGVAYDDYLLFSTARLGHTETVGVLGQVVVIKE
ncbi:MAG: hypothetical protein H7Z12_10630 [Rhodospirillaceae bacterium]|nr:hypothetical protein [Rhodospirillales bacterium]